MSGRVSWIDWLKVIIVFGVFLYHAAQPFVLTTWLVTAPERSVVLSVLAGAGYLFGMPLMFLLAGATIWLALGRRGLNGFIGLRIRRLLIPLVLGIALLSPFQAWIASGAHVSPIGFVAEFWSGARFSLNPQWLGDYGYHLWFLGFLFCYSLMALPVVAWLRRGPARAAGALAPLVEGWGGLALLLAALVVVQLALRPLAPAYRDWADFALWFIYLLAGVALATDERLVRGIVARRRAILGITGSLALGYLPVALTGSVLDLEHAPGYGPGGLAYIALRTSLGMSLVLVFIGFAARYLTARPRALARASDAVLPFYVLHHPVVVLVASWVVTLQLGLWPAFGLIVALSLAGTLLTYTALVLGIGAVRSRWGRQAEPPALAVPEAGS